jgi:DNA-binding transcriptional ArsR family regulator
MPKELDAPVETHIFTLEQAELLASAQKAEVFWSFSPSEPRSISQIAKALGKSASTTTYHVHELEDAGILITAGERKRRSRMEKLYLHAARSFFGAGPSASKEYREKSVEAFAAMARLMARERQMANETFDFNIELSRFMTFGRFSQMVTADRAEEFGGRMLGLLREFSQEPPDENGTRISFVFNMTPTLGESRRFLAERKKGRDPGRG